MLLDFSGYHCFLLNDPFISSLNSLSVCYLNKGDFSKLQLMHNWKYSIRNQQLRDSVKKDMSPYSVAQRPSV